MPYLPSSPTGGPSHQQTGGAPRRPVKPRGSTWHPQHRPAQTPRPAPSRPLSEASWALGAGPARAKPLSEGAWALSGGGGHHHHHHGGGRRGGWGGPWYPAGLPTIVEDPCTTPWLYPPGTCAQILAAQRGFSGFGDAGAYQEARQMKVSLERVEGVGGACCEGCGSGSQCSGLGGIPEAMNLAPIAGFVGGIIYAARKKKSKLGYGIVGLVAGHIARLVMK